jgi:hypothetical protein
MQKYERTEGIKVNEVLFNNIGYADDTILITSNEVEPQLLNCISEKSIRRELNINT